MAIKITTQTLPVATTTEPGIVKIGTGLNVATDGSLSLAGNPNLVVETTDSSQTVHMKAIKGEKTGELTVAVDSSGNMTTSAPSPAWNSNNGTIATTKWVNDYSFPLNKIAETSGAVTLEANKVYSVTLDGNMTFTLTPPTNTDIYNQIKLMMKVDSLGTIDWGTTYFYNGLPPDVTGVGSYAIYFDWDTGSENWVCGAMVVASIA